MGKSYQSHGKKSDKETQSPVLKLFKEIMKRENTDPEKAKLLKEKKQRKRKQHSSSRSKNEIKSGDKTDTECNPSKTKVHYDAQERDRAYSQCRTHSVPCASEKRDSWWVFRNDNTDTRRNDDTFSCVSCALKKLVSNEYACVGCLLVLFTITVVVAFLLVFRSMHVVAETAGKARSYNEGNLKNKDSEIFKKKIDMLSGNGHYLRGRRDGDGSKTSVWGDVLSRHMDGLSRIADSGYGDSSMMQSSFVDADGRQTDDLASILESNKFNDGQSSDVLRNFYKKLIQTDAQIKHLKTNHIDNSLSSISNMASWPYRYKRSLFHRRKKPLVDIKEKKNFTAKANTKSTVNKHHNGSADGNLTHSGKIKPKIAPKKQLKVKKDKRAKIFSNGSEVPAGFIFEKKKLMIQYMPDAKKKIPKCSHTPTDTKSHENNLKHPFYKNTQRLDEMLDQVLDKTFPEIINDQFGVDKLLNPDKPKCLHEDKATTQNALQLLYATTEKVYHKYVKPSAKKLKNELLRMLKVDSVTKRDDKERVTTEHPASSEWERVEGDMEGEEDIDRATSTTASYDLMLSITTLLNPSKKRMNKMRSNHVQDSIPSRKLMQVDDEEDESFGYEDFKDVLSDNMEAHDETDRQDDRWKREEIILDKIQELVPKPVTNNPPGVYNPNWKGPIPLYPEELSTMMKNPYDIIKVPISSETKEVTDENEKGNKLTDLDDYLNTKNDRFVKLAQAYSDYGVLNAKQTDVKNEKSGDLSKVDLRVKLAADKSKSNVVCGNSKKALIHEAASKIYDGLKFVVRPQGSGDEGGPKRSEFMKGLSKHMKFKAGNQHKKHRQQSSTLSPPLSSEYNLLYSKIDMKSTTIKDKKSEENSDYKYEYTNRLVKRSLKSFENSNYESEVYNNDYDEDTENVTEPVINIDFNPKSEVEEENITEIKNKTTRNSTDVTGNSQLNVFNNSSADENSTISNFVVIDDYFPDNVEFAIYEESVNKNSDFKNLLRNFTGLIISMDEPFHKRLNSSIDVDTNGHKLVTKQKKLNKNMNSTSALNIDEQHLADDVTEESVYINIDPTSIVRVIRSFESPEFNSKIDKNSKFEVDFEFNVSNKEVPNQNSSKSSTNPQFTDGDIIAILNDVNVTDSKTIDTEIGTKTEDTKNGRNNTNVIDSIAKDTNVKDAGTKEQIDGGDFFMMLSNWFSTLAGLSEGNTSAGPGSNIITLLTKLGDVENKTINKEEIMYPMYDAEVVDNIAHRSRVLLSFEEGHGNMTGVENLETTERIEDVGRKRDVGNDKVTNRSEGIKFEVRPGSSNDYVEPPRSFGIKIKDDNSNTTKCKKPTKTNDNRKENHVKKLIINMHVENQNNSEYKRSIADNNLVFSNDMYDDEYGIPTDPLDNDMKDKGEASDMMKKSEMWLGSKVKKFSDTIIKSSRDGWNRLYGRKVMFKDLGHRDAPENNKDEEHKINKRDIVGINDANVEGEKKNSFAVLTANMKEVCKQAAAAVKHTRNLKARDDDVSGPVTTGLMREVVKLMSELVNFQVQQKTCLQLPADLKNFLVWLTAPNIDDETSASNFDGFTEHGTYEKEEPSANLDLLTQPSSEKEDVHTEARSECLGTLQAVQELMHQYYAMSDEDKSKMSGIQEYLENQLYFLHSKLGAIDELHGDNIYKKIPLRYRRHVSIPNNENRRNPSANNKLGNKGRHNKFVKNFGKKHTRTTANNIDAVLSTDALNKDVKREGKSARDVKDNKEIDRKRRTLLNVYYRAVEDAKKYTTAKTMDQKSGGLGNRMT